MSTFFIIIFIATATFFSVLVGLKVVPKILSTVLQYCHIVKRSTRRFFLAPSVDRLIRKYISRPDLERDLAPVLDLLSLSLAAGASLELAVRQAAQRLSGRWGAELSRIVQYLDYGLDFSTALSRSAERLNLPAFSRLILALNQAQRLGVPLKTSLALEAKIMRTRARYGAEEFARKAAVKISLPLVLCIFPALMIIYLAPALLRLLEGL